MDNNVADHIENLQNKVEQLEAKLLDEIKLTNRLSKIVGTQCQLMDKVIVTLESIQRLLPRYE